MAPKLKNHIHLYKESMLYINVLDLMIFFISANVVHTLIKNTYPQTFLLLALQWSRWKDFFTFDLTFFYMESRNYQIALSKTFLILWENIQICNRTIYHSNYQYDNDYVYDNRGAFIEGFDCLFITKRIHTNFVYMLSSFLRWLHTGWL